MWVHGANHPDLRSPACVVDGAGTLPPVHITFRDNFQHQMHLTEINGLAHGKCEGEPWFLIVFDVFDPKTKCSPHNFRKFWQENV